jgi:radical SAM superfamily enzyme YgiQ (UPF0313 family)
MNELSFEQGPIRPPSEAQSLLLRLTRNCPWNQCLFCPVYKGTKFSMRSVEEIKRDIHSAKEIASDIKALSWRMGASGRVDDAVVRRILSSSHLSEQYKSVAAWLYYGTGAVFLQDADNLVMKTNELVEVLSSLREAFPEITRVTTYSRSRTIVRKSLDSLKRIREAGLDRVHVGLESGYDRLLKFMKKGVTAEQHIIAGRLIIEAGMELSEYVMPGLGGAEMWREHAIKTAEVINSINPHFIRLRSLRVPPSVPLYEKVTNGDFRLQSDEMIVEEIRLFIEHLEGITSVVTSDHIMNLLEDVSGRLPEDKPRMLEAIDAYRRLTESDKIIYRLGRRAGAYRGPGDLKTDALTYAKIKALVEDISRKQGSEGVDLFISQLADRYI